MQYPEISFFLTFIFKQRNSNSLLQHESCPYLESRTSGGSAGRSCPGASLERRQSWSSSEPLLPLLALLALLPPDTRPAPGHSWWLVVTSGDCGDCGEGWGPVATVAVSTESGGRPRCWRGSIRARLSVQPPQSSDTNTDVPSTDITRVGVCPERVFHLHLVFSKSRERTSNFINIYMYFMQPLI